MTYFEGLLEEKSCKLSIELLEKEYDIVKSKGEIDERVFLNEENSLLGSGSLSGGGLNISGSKVGRSLSLSLMQTQPDKSQEIHSMFLVN